MTNEQLRVIEARAWEIVNTSLTVELNIVAVHALHARIEGALREQALRHKAEVARLQVVVQAARELECNRHVPAAPMPWGDLAAALAALEATP